MSLCSFEHQHMRFKPPMQSLYTKMKATTANRCYYSLLLSLKLTYFFLFPICPPNEMKGAHADVSFDLLGYTLESVMRRRESICIFISRLNRRGKGYTHRVGGVYEHACMSGCMCVVAAYGASHHKWLPPMVRVSLLEISFILNSQNIQN